MTLTTSRSHIKRPLTQTQDHLIQSRRCMEQHQAFWNGIKDYFNSCNLMSSKHTSWTAPDFYTLRSLSSFHYWHLKVAFLSCAQDDLELLISFHYASQ
uniref:Uncharacterized protein n=1 Tax=Timema douglasi TaxID=61478 RepID=A0A7R8Z662_TIMDO|nr:unnamed protein product [Timema douglasi]